MVDLGKKHECPSCGAKFYDLGRPEVVCPKCGANPSADEEEEAKAPAKPARRSKASSKAASSKAASTSPDAGGDDKDGDKDAGNDDSEE